MSRVIKVGLILLLVFVSVIIVWIGLKAIINYNSESITIGKYNSDLRISQVQMMNYEDINVKLKKTSYQDEIKGVNFVVYNKEGSEMTRYHISMEELEQNYFQVVLSVENTSNVRKITIAPVILSKSGEQIVGNLQDEYKVTGTATVFNPPKEDTGYAENRVKYCTFASDCKDDDPCTSGACSGGLCSYPVIHGCEFCVSDLECNDNNSCTNNLCVEERCSYPVIDGCQSCRY
ncbi:MAG: hypothetical protein NTZ83_03970, partial [Candidatus Pacearchaeota archaeon]|nr:hypothetical protein [Candidatus Pacearchaeota archaeon]